MKELDDDDVKIRGEEERVMVEKATPSSLNLPAEASMSAEVRIVDDVDSKRMSEIVMNCVLEIVKNGSAEVETAFLVV